MVLFYTQIRQIKKRTYKSAIGVLGNPYTRMSKPAMRALFSCIILKVPKFQWQKFSKTLSYMSYFILINSIFLCYTFEICSRSRYKGKIF